MKKSLMHHTLWTFFFAEYRCTNNVESLWKRCITWMPLLESQKGLALARDVGFHGVGGGVKSDVSLLMHLYFMIFFSLQAGGRGVLVVCNFVVQSLLCIPVCIDSSLCVHLFGKMTILSFRRWVVSGIFSVRPRCLLITHSHREACPHHFFSSATNRKRPKKKKSMQPRPPIKKNNKSFICHRDCTARIVPSYRETRQGCYQSKPRPSTWEKVFYHHRHDSSAWRYEH